MSNISKAATPAGAQYACKTHEAERPSRPPGSTTTKCIAPGAPLDHPQSLPTVQAHRSHTHGPHHALRPLAQAMPASVSTNPSATGINDQINSLKTELAETQPGGKFLDAGLEGIVDFEIADRQAQLSVNFVSPLNQRSKNIENYIADLKNSDADPALIKEWEILKKFVDLKCLILRQKIQTRMEEINSVNESIRAAYLEGTIKISQELTGANFVSPLEQLPKKLETAIKQLGKAKAGPSVINDWKILTGLVGRKIIIVKNKKDILAQEVADAGVYANKLIDPKITDNERIKLVYKIMLIAGHYSEQMPSLYGERPGGYNFTITFDPANRYIFNKIVDDLHTSDGSLLDAEARALLKGAVSSSPTAIANPSI